MRRTTHRETCAKECSRRTSAQWLPLFVLVVLLAAVPACKQTSQQAMPAELDTAVEQNIEIANSVPPRQRKDKPKFVEQKLEDLTSPFTKETVLALNAIVSRSLSAIESFDETRREIKNDNNDVQRDEVLATYTKLSRETKQAKDDMAAAAERLRDSNERYNKAIFAAMVQFVNNVDNEIHSEIAKL